jgi:rubrerythrin
MRWTLDNINWEAFELEHVDSETLQAVKAASLVEANAPDYVSYLCNVFSDNPKLQEDIRQWGREERQHGVVLAKWAKLADPDFDFDDSFERFRKIQGIQTDAIESVRGSRAGEMISRCVVESGTSSFYTAIKDTTQEPVLRQIATYLAADEFAHYRLFYETFKNYQGELPTVWQRLRIAVGRVNEADDDELSGAYYCANYPADSETAYDRKTFANAYERRVLSVYQRKHIDRLIAMVAKAGGLKPQGRLVRFICALAWHGLSIKQKWMLRSAV